MSGSELLLLSSSIAIAIDEAETPLVGESESFMHLVAPNGLARQRCQPGARNLLRIGRGASPDGRPEGCRLFAFLRRIRTRDMLLGVFRRRALPPLRFRDGREIDGVFDPTLFAVRSSSRSPAMGERKR